jgi:hypothetical protein
MRVRAPWLTPHACLFLAPQLRIIDFGLALDAPGHAAAPAPAASPAASAASGAAASGAAAACSDAFRAFSGASSGASDGSASAQFFGTSQYASRRALAREPLSYRDGAKTSLSFVPTHTHAPTLSDPHAPASLFLPPVRP